MRSLLIFITLVLLYYTLKTLFRSALKAYHENEPRRRRLKGEDMVLDPECRTYVVKDRAVTRRIKGSIYSFCSEACAERYEEAHR
jgi:YHS domain-containing protein